MFLVRHMGWHMVQAALVAAAVSSAVLSGGAVPASAQDRPDAARAEALISAYVRDFVARANMTFDPPRVRTEFVELNGTEPPEAVVFLEGLSWCGAFGCTVAVLDLAGDAASSVADLTALTVEPQDTRTNGWRDLVANGTNHLAFDGTRYVTAPAAAAPAPAVPGPAAADQEDRASGIGCSGLPVEAEIDLPLELRDPTAAPPEDMEIGQAFSFTGSDDVIAVRAADAATYYDGLGGDDLIYVDRPELPLSIEAGNGADTIVVCGFASPEMSIWVGRVDLASDLVVIDVPAFLDPPGGEADVDRLLHVGGFASQNDRVVIRLPPGVEPRITQQRDGDVLVAVGHVTIDLDTVRDWAPFDGTSVQIVAADGTRQHVPDALPPQFPEVDLHLANGLVLGGRPLDLSGAAYAGPLQAPACPQDPGDVTRPEPLPVESIPYNALPADDARRWEVDYGPGDDTVVFVGDRSIAGINGGGGDDTLLLFGPTNSTEVVGDTGADTIVLCRPSTQGLRLSVVLGIGESSDLEPDTVVVEPEMLDGIPPDFFRLVTVHDFVPANDRVILRLPPGTEVSYEERSSGAVRLRVGGLYLILYRSDELLDHPFNNSSVVFVPTDFDLAEPTPRARDTDSQPVAAWQWGETTTLDGRPAQMVHLGHDCRDIATPPADLVFSQPQPVAPDIEEIFPGIMPFSRGNDLIRLVDVPQSVFVVSGPGDDTIYFLNNGDYVTVEGGSGADTFVVCTMVGASLNLSMARYTDAVDRFADTVVIEPPVFQNIPEGLLREISLTGFLSVNDRLELRVPPGVDVEPTFYGGLLESLDVGQVRIFFFSGPGHAFVDEPFGFDPASITIVRAQAP